MFEIVKANKINLEVENPWLVSSSFIKDSLRESVISFGIITPVYLIRKTDGTLIPLTGLKRILLAQKLNIDLKAMVINEPPLEKAPDIFLTGLEDNLHHRTLSPLEKSIALNKFAKLHSPNLTISELKDQLAQKLELPQKEDIIEQCLSFTNFSETIQDKITTGEINEAQAFLISRLEGESQDLFCDIIAGRGQLNASESKDLFQIISDLKNEYDPTVLLKSKEIGKLLENDSLNARQKGNKIKEHLYRLRFPEYSQALNHFQHLTSKIIGNEKLQFNAPRFFEGDFLEISLKIKNPDDLKRMLKTLSSALDEGTIDNLISGIRSGNFNKNNKNS